MLEKRENYDKSRDDTLSGSQGLALWKQLIQRQCFSAGRSGTKNGSEDPLTRSWTKSN